MPEHIVSKLLSKRKLRQIPVEMTLSPKENSFLGGGAEASVNRVDVSVRNRSVPQGLAYKEYNVGKGAEQAIVAWRELKNAGVPVPQTFRIVGEPERYSGILMTDLTRGWRDILLTSNSTKVHVIENIWNVSPWTVEKLAQLDMKKVMEEQGIEKLFHEMAKKMANAKIEIIHADVVSIVFTEDGKLQPVISDMKNVFYQSQKPTETLAKINEQRLNDSILWLHEGQRLARETMKLHASM